MAVPSYNIYNNASTGKRLQQYLELDTIPWFVEDCAHCFLLVLQFHTKSIIVDDYINLKMQGAVIPDANFFNGL